MCAADEPLKKGLEALDTKLDYRAHIGGEQVRLRAPGAAGWAPYAAGRKVKLMFWLAYP